MSKVLAGMFLMVLAMANWSALWIYGFGLWPVRWWVLFACLGVSMILKKGGETWLKEIIAENK